MRHNKRIFTYALIFLSFSLLFIFMFFCFKSDSSKKSIISAGVLNISNLYEQEDEILPLSGEWEFYWNRFVTAADIKNGEKPDVIQSMPQVWNRYKIDGKSLPGFGYGSYRIKVTGVQEGKKLALWVPTFSTAYRLYINDKLTASSGIVSKNKQEGIPQYKPTKVEINPDDSSFDIIIQVSNYSYARGGMWYTVYMGTDQMISNMSEDIRSRDLFLLGSFFVMTIIYGAIYFLRRQERGHLYFALLCIIAASRTLLHGSYFINKLIPSVPFWFVIRLDYLVLYWFPVVLALLLSEIFKEALLQKSQQIFIAYAVLMSLFTIFTPIWFFTRFVYLAELIMFCIAIFLFVKTITVLWQSKINAVLIFIGCYTVLTGSVYDVLFQNSLIAGGLYELTPVGFFIMLVLQAIVLARSVTATIKKKEDALAELHISFDRERKAELKFLKSQIRPHFVFNALNTIISVSRNDVEHAQGLLMDFSSYLRGFFDYKDLDDIVPLEKELEFVKAYITLEQARFGEKLCVEYDIDDIECMVPPLVLQPLVENAVVHGIRPKADGGNIVIYAKWSDEKVRIGVRDDGAGISDDKIQNLISGKEAGRGVGIYNITNRLNKLYGISLKICRIDSGGLDVNMELPLYLENIKG